MKFTTDAGSHAILICVVMTVLSYFIQSAVKMHFVSINL